MKPVKTPPINISSNVATNTGNSWYTYTPNSSSASAGSVYPNTTVIPEYSKPPDVLGELLEAVKNLTEEVATLIERFDEWERQE